MSPLRPAEFARYADEPTRASPAALAQVIAELRRAERDDWQSDVPWLEPGSLTDRIS